MSVRRDMPTDERCAETYSEIISIVSHPAFRLGFMDAQQGRPLALLQRELDDARCLDWVVCGGECGLGGRLFSIDWARSIIAQCKAAGVPCFIKQLGARPTADDPAKFGNWMLHDRKGGNPAEWPEDLRVREFPEPRDG